MKYFILVFVLTLLWLAWCSQHMSTSTNTGYFLGQINEGLIDYNKPITTFSTWEQTNFHHPMPWNDSSSNISITWKVMPGIWLSKSIPTFFLHGDTLTYSGLFSISIPKSVLYREYQGWAFESLSFSDSNQKSYFHIGIWQPWLSIERKDDKSQCEDNSGIWSTVSILKVKQGRKIYITTTTFPDSKEQVHGLCFVNNGLVYNIEVTNYNKAYTEQIFNSMNFITKFPPKQAIATSWSKPLQSIMNNPISSIYNTIILSWHILVYSWIFHIELPEYLQFRKSIYPWNNGVEIYFTDKKFLWFQLDDVRYVHLVTTPITTERGESDYDRCKPENQFGWYSNISETTTWDNGNILYKNYRSYESFGYSWKEWNLCFVLDNMMYNITIRWYAIPDIISSSDSFHFDN